MINRGIIQPPNNSDPDWSPTSKSRLAERIEQKLNDFNHEARAAAEERALDELKHNPNAIVSLFCPMDESEIIKIKTPKNLENKILKPTYRCKLCKQVFQGWGNSIHLIKDGISVPEITAIVSIFEGFQ